MPPLDLDYWRDSAANGGTNVGDLEIYSAMTEIGPLKITGDLIIENNSVVTVNGPIWIQGDIILNNNVEVSLNIDFGPNSTLITTDGTVSIFNNAVINGSGHINSFILLHTTNTSEDAISVENNVGGAVFYAPDGKANISNNAQITSVAANEINLDNNCEIDYNSAYHDASDLRLATEANGEWTIVSSTWRESAF